MTHLDMRQRRAAPQDYSHLKKEFAAKNSISTIKPRHKKSFSEPQGFAFAPSHEVFLASAGLK
jgi:hypothetical protein